MKKNDFVYYAGWLTMLILMGVWMLLWAMGTVHFGEAVLLWLLSGGILLIIIGSISGSWSSSSFQLGAGMVLSVFMLMMLAISSNIIGGIVGAALGIILIGIIGLVLLLRNIKLEE